MGKFRVREPVGEPKCREMSRFVALEKNHRRASSVCGDVLSISSFLANARRSYNVVHHSSKVTQSGRVMPYGRGATAVRHGIYGSGRLTHRFHP